MKISRGLYCFCFVLFFVLFFCFILFCFSLFFVFVSFCLFVCFFHCLSLFETTEICFGCTKWKISTGKKAYFTPWKIGKSEFAPSEKCSSYAAGFEIQQYIFFSTSQAKQGLCDESRDLPLSVLVLI